MTGVLGGERETVIILFLPNEATRLFCFVLVGFIKESFAPVCQKEEAFLDEGSYALAGGGGGEDAR